MNHLPAISLVVNFLILVFALVYFTRKPVVSMMKDKKDTWKKDIEETEALRQETQKMFDQYKEKLGNLDQKAQQIVEDAKERGAQIKQNMIAQAEKDAEKIIANAKNQSDMEELKAKKSIKHKTMGAAVSLAQSKLKDQIGLQEHDTLINTFINDLENDNLGRHA